MLELLDLRERGERLEPSRLETDPTVTETVRGILQRVCDQGDDGPDRARPAVRRRRSARVGPHRRPTTSSTAGRARHARRAARPRSTRCRAARTTSTPASSRANGGRSATASASARSCGRSRAVGCYVPGGRAVYPSSVCMTVVPAVVAGVDEIVLCTPPQPTARSPRPSCTRPPRGRDARREVAAARRRSPRWRSGPSPCRASIASSARATPTSPRRSDRSPASSASTASPGPSELAIVADGDVDPALAAIDLIAQAEHDPEARHVLHHDRPALIDEGRCGARARARDARAGARSSTQALRHARSCSCATSTRRREVVDDLAAEHLLLLLDEPRAFLPKVRNAGAVFLGPWTAVPFGDYGVASNHVLPTAGTARFASGLRAADYVTVRRWSRCRAEAARRFAPGDVDDRREPKGSSVTRGRWTSRRAEAAPMSPTRRPRARACAT